MDCSTPGSPFPTLSLGVCSNSCPLSQWCYLTISSSVTPFSFCLLSFPASGSFPVSQLFMSGGQSTGTSASASALPTNSQGWLPLGLNGLISLLSKALSRVFSSTTVWKHQFFSAQPSLRSNSYLYMTTGKTIDLIILYSLLTLTAKFIHFFFSLIETSLCLALFNQ